MSKEITYRKVYCKDRLPSHSLSSCETYSTSLGELMWWGTDWHLDVGYERPEYWFEPIQKSKVEENIIPISANEMKCVECNFLPAKYDYNGCGHWVCKPCGDSLEKEFDEEYR